MENKNKKSKETSQNIESAKAKQKTIEELQNFEKSKLAADKSLREKLNALSSELPEEEKGMLDKLLAIEQPISIVTDNNPDVSVFLKPQQKHMGEEISVFLKPQQSHVGSDIAVFLKPQQAHSGTQVTVKFTPQENDETTAFLKPQQSHGIEKSQEAFLKPQQSHGVDKEQEAFLKPQQSHGVEKEQEAFLKPQQSHPTSHDEQK